MKDKAFMHEVRRRVAVLESQYETMGRDVKAARTFLAMLERQYINDSQNSGDRSHIELVGDFIADLLSHQPEMHRKDLLKGVLSKGVHIGNDDDPQKQLSTLSTILSKDTRFKPVEGRSGYWTFAKIIDLRMSAPEDDTSKTSQSPGHILAASASEAAVRKVKKDLDDIFRTEGTYLSSDTVIEGETTFEQEELDTHEALFA